VPASHPFDELISEPHEVRRRDLRQPTTRRSRRAASKRVSALNKAEDNTRPSGRRAQPGRRVAEPTRRRASSKPAATAKSVAAKPAIRKPLAQRIVTKLFPVAALAFAAALIVGTSVPASAFSSPTKSTTVNASVTRDHGATITAQSLHDVKGTSTPVSRDQFEAMSEQELTRIQEQSAGAGYTVNNSGPIRWPFDVAVPLGDPFGPRIAPCRGCSTFHNGTDFETGGGASIYTVAAGVVTESDYSGALGEHVAISHTVNGNTFTSIYGHMEAGSSPLVVGQQVVEGQFVGFTGSTGTSTGPHLDFEIDIDGTPVDSFAWLKANTAQ
jgi:murein DD-endopeptidase MepM/ murein hydrolase activator NlpD